MSTTTDRHKLTELVGPLALVWALLEGLRKHDRASYAHSLRVACGAMLVARQLGHADPSMLYLAGLAHDLGKTAVRRKVLRKPGGLTGAETSHMKMHVEHGVAILKAVPGLDPAIIRGCAEHHEKLDGTGYPDGLRGGELGVEGRVLAVVDLWEAMSSPRPYKPARPADVVDRVIAQASGVHFDADVVEAFFSCRRELEAITFIDRLQVVA